MSISRSQLGRSPAIVTINGATLFMRDDLMTKHNPVWVPEKCSIHGQVDKSKKDLVIKHNLLLFGLWQSLSAIFPSYLLNPTVGTNIFGTSDNAMVVQGRNTDRITYPNSQVTKLAELYCGVDSELFAAAVEVTSLIKNNANPEDTAAYFTRDTNAYSETTFSMANFKRVRFTGAWGAITGFTSFVPQKGFRVSWAADLKPDTVDGLGTVSMYVGDGSVVGSCRGIPIGPTGAQVDTAQAVAAAHGTLLSANSADLTLAGSGISIVLKNAGMVESSVAWGADPLRVNEVGWETTRGMTAGVAQAVSTLS